MPQIQVTRLVATTATVEAQMEFLGLERFGTGTPGAVRTRFRPTLADGTFDASAERSVGDVVDNPSHPNVNLQQIASDIRALILSASIQTTPPADLSPADAADYTARVQRVQAVLAAAGQTTAQGRTVRGFGETMIGILKAQGRLTPESNL